MFCCIFFGMIKRIANSNPFFLYPKSIYSHHFEQCFLQAERKCLPTTAGLLIGTNVFNDIAVVLFVAFFYASHSCTIIECPIRWSYTTGSILVFTMYRLSISAVHVFTAGESQRISRNSARDLSYLNSLVTL